jgi:hypothetical protein
LLQLENLEQLPFDFVQVEGFGQAAAGARLFGLGGQLVG